MSLAEVITSFILHCCCWQILEKDKKKWPQIQMAYTSVKIWAWWTSFGGLGARLLNGGAPGPLRTAPESMTLFLRVASSAILFYMCNLRSMCFFLGGVCSSVVALQTNLASRSPARLCLAAVTRSTRLWPATFGLCRNLFIFIAIKKTKIILRNKCRISDHT